MLVEAPWGLRNIKEENELTVCREKSCQRRTSLGQGRQVGRAAMIAFYS